MFGGDWFSEMFSEKCLVGVHFIELAAFLRWNVFDEEKTVNSMNDNFSARGLWPNFFVVGWQSGESVEWGQAMGLWLCAIVLIFILTSCKVSFCLNTNNHRSLTCHHSAESPPRSPSIFVLNILIPLSKCPNTKQCYNHRFSWKTIGGSRNLTQDLRVIGPELTVLC